MIKRAISLICLLFILSTAVILPVCADTTAETTEFDDYSGPIDPFSGDERTDDENDSGKETLIYITDKMYYSVEKNRFAFPIGDSGQYVYSDVPDGGLSLTKLAFDVPDGVVISLYRNGKKQKTDASYSASLVGDYKMIATLASGEAEIMTFSIINSRTGSLEYFRMPSGFHIIELSIDGETKEGFDADTVDLTAEGTYRIVYRNTKIDKDFDIEFTVDHTAPLVTLKGVTDGYADGPVTLVSVNEEANVAVYYKGKLQENPGTRFTKAGNYRIIAADIAGNVTTVDFRIKIYFNLSAVVSLIILGVIVVIVAVYLIIRRKRMRVR